MKIIEYTAINSEGNEIIHICIDDENGNLKWMPKSTYDAMQAEQSTPSLENGTIS